MGTPETFLERFYKPLFIAFLVGIVVLAYVLGKRDGALAASHGVTLACDSDTLETLSMQPALAQALTASVATQQVQQAGTVAHNFVASKNGTKYYPAGCSAANRIKAENQIWFASEADATLQGYTRTTAC